MVYMGNREDLDLFTLLDRCNQIRICGQLIGIVLQKFHAKGETRNELSVFRENGLKCKNGFLINNK